MGNRKVIFLDMDDTITELLDPWVGWLNKEHNLNVKIEDIKEWDMSKAFPTLTKEELYKPLNSGKEFWGNIKPIKDAQHYVQKLQEKYDVYIVTATHYKNILPKIEYVLSKYFPAITDRNIIFIYNKKLLKGFVMVDDNEKNLDTDNYIGILVDKPYNRNTNKDFIRVSNWEEIYNKIIEIDEYLDLVKRLE